MRSQLVLSALATILVAAAAAPASSEIVTCSDSAHVSWRADDSFTLIDGAVVSVPGCDNGEAVGLQVLTTEGDVPNDPLLAPAEDDEATFDLEPYELRIEPVIGVRVFLNGRPVAVDEDDTPEVGDTPEEDDMPEEDDTSEEEDDGGTDVGGVVIERPTTPPEGRGVVGDMPVTRPTPAPPAEREGGPLTLSTTGVSVATLTGLAVAALLAGGLLRRYRHRSS